MSADPSNMHTWEPSPLRTNLTVPPGVALIQFGSILAAWHAGREKAIQVDISKETDWPVEERDRRVISPMLRGLQEALV